MLFLHDRSIPGTRANIDHLAVTRGAARVIDSKKWAGKIEKRLVGPPFVKEPHLYVRGRDRSDALTLLSWQMEVMEALAGPAPQCRSGSGRSALSVRTGASSKDLSSSVIRGDLGCVSSPDSRAEDSGDPGSSAIDLVEDRKQVSAEAVVKDLVVGSELCRTWDGGRSAPPASMLSTLALDRARMSGFRGNRASAS